MWPWIALTAAEIGLSAWQTYLGKKAGDAAAKAARAQQKLNEQMLRSNIRVDYEELSANMALLNEYLKGSTDSNKDGVPDESLFAGIQQSARQSFKQQAQTQFQQATEARYEMKAKEGMQNLMAGALGLIGGGTSAGLLGSKLVQERRSYENLMKDYFGVVEGFDASSLAEGSFLGGEWKILIGEQQVEVQKILQEEGIMETAKEELKKQYKASGGLVKEDLEDLKEEIYQTENGPVSVYDRLASSGLDLTPELLGEDVKNEVDTIRGQLKKEERKWKISQYRFTPSDSNEDTGQEGEGLPIDSGELTPDDVGDYGGWYSDDYGSDY